jgi:hypothetical protein
MRNNQAMKILWSVGLSVLVLLSAIGQQKKSKEITILGEVVDIQCYVSGATGPGKGPYHKECAISCAKGGMPIGILEDGTDVLYVAGQTKTAMKNANELLLPFVAEKVKVTGRVYEKGGMKLLLVNKVSLFTGK